MMELDFAFLGPGARRQGLYSMEVGGWEAVDMAIDGSSASEFSAGMGEYTMVSFDIAVHIAEHAFPHRHRQSLHCQLSTSCTRSPS